LIPDPEPDMAALELEDVSFTYPSTRFGLTGVSMSADRGEMVGLLGPNGSGKSTLLKLFVGPEALDHLPHTGRVAIDGQTQLSPRQRAQRVAYLPQHIPSDLAFTCREVVKLGRFPRLSWLASVEDREDPSVALAMEQCEVTHLADRRYTEISGGERQRVMLAAAIAQDTEVLLLDEPTSALDLQYALQILEILAQLVADRRRTVILGSHDVNLVSAFCHRLVVLANGRIAADGPPAEVLTEGLMADVYGVSAKLLPVDGRPAPIIVPTRRSPRAQ
jgi:iron complex transport system ATP-binding protein